ncbi:MAG: hypothetical protein WD154_08020 [Nitrosopumilaceae archaeon]
MKNILLLKAVKEKPVVAILSAIGIFFVNPLIQLFSTSLAFEIWYTDLFQKPLSSIPYVVLSILFGAFIALYLYSKNKRIDCKIGGRGGFGGSIFGFMIGVCPACFSFIGFLLPLSGTLFLTNYSPLFLLLSTGIILFSIYKIGGFKELSIIHTKDNNSK